MNVKNIKSTIKFVLFYNFSDPEEPEEAKQDALCGAPLIVKVESRVANHTPAAIEEHSYVETMHNVRRIVLYNAATFSCEHLKMQLTTSLVI